MKTTRMPGRRPPAVRFVVPIAVALATVLAAPAPAAVSAAGAPGDPVAGYGVTDVPNGEPGKPLPVKTGQVAVRTGRVRDVARAGGADQRAAAEALAATPQLTKTGLRALVLAVDEADYGLPTWRQTLDNVGAAYDVVLTKDTALTLDTLVRADGAGRYNAVLLTSNSLLYPDPAAPNNYISGLSADEWNLLWAYERDYTVRQAVLYSSYGTWPENYCLLPSSEGGVGDTPLNAQLTSAGAVPFRYLKSGAQIPIVQSYVYRTRLAAGCNASAMLTAGADVLGVMSTSTDGRQRLALTFTSNQYLLQSQLLPYGLFRWASRGLFLGEMRHSLNADVDDWFNISDLWINGQVSTTTFYEMTGHDANNAWQQENALRSRYPLASAFVMNMAYNAEGANLAAGSNCSPNGGINTLTATSKCLRNRFKWVNHTYSHLKLNFTDYTTSYNDINQNIQAAATLGLPNAAGVLKTGEYSGLGVYHPDPNNDIDPPTDYGILASNQAMLDAAAALGISYLHGNMSFASHRPSCFNCALVHPMKTSLLVVPDWPTNIAYFSNTPESETSFYNYFYGPNGRFPYWPTDRTYAQVIAAESDIGLQHVASGSIYSHTFHIPNLDDYSAGKTLLSDWADAVMAKYSTYFSVPLLSQGWPGIATYTADRNAHFAARSSVDAVYDSATNRVTVLSPVTGKAQITGARTSGFTNYGDESSAVVSFTANQAVLFTPVRLP